MRTVASAIMVLAVVLTLLGPVSLSFCAPDAGGEASALVTLNVCNASGGSSVVPGVLVYIHQLAALLLFFAGCVLFRRPAEIISIPVFQDFFLRPPRG